MKIAERFSHPVAQELWKPGSYRNLGGDREYRHFGIIQELNGTSSYHTGTDIDLEAGKEVRCIADGIIVAVETPDDSGLSVVVKHQLSVDPDDVIFSAYLHLNTYQRLSKLAQGEPIYRGQGIARVAPKGKLNGGYGSHLHFGLFRGEPPKIPRSGYHYDWQWGGYGHVKERLEELRKAGDPDYTKELYRTIVGLPDKPRIGGSAIDPVAFFDKYLTRPIAFPEPLHVFTIKASADPSKSGQVFFEKRFQRPRNGRYILHFSGRAKSGKQNYPRKLRGDDDDGRWTLNDIDPRSLLDRIFQGSHEMNGALSKDFPQDFFLFVNTKSGIEELTALDQAEQVFTFYADESPYIDRVEVLPWEDSEQIHLDFFETAPFSSIKASGLPWKTFLMLGCPALSAEVSGNCQGALMCSASDDQGMQVFKNDEPLKNTLFPNSRKYGNWVFSGDQDKGACKTVTIGKFPNQAFNALELRVDNQAMLEKVVFRF